MRATPSHHVALIGLAIAAALALAVACPTPLHAGEAGGLAALVEKLPADDPAVANDVYKQILAGGADSVVALTKMLTVPETGGDAKVRYTVHGLAIHVYRQGAEAERKTFSQALVKQLASNLPASIRGFLIRQLQLAGGPEAIEAIGKYLTDKDLCEYAAQALLAMKDKAVIPQFQQALPKAKGGCRLTIIQALGVLKAAKGVATVHKALGDDDRRLRLAAAYALANSADPTAVDPLLKAADAKTLYERSQATDAVLLLARTLGAAGEKKAAERVCRQLLKTRTGDEELHVRCAALMALATALGADAMDDVLAAMSSEEPDLQKAGIAAAIAMPGERATRRWVDRMKQANPAGKVAILDLLAQRGDTAALPAVLQTMKDTDEKVRLASIQTAGQTGNATAVEPLAAALASQSAAERGAARAALLRIPGKPVTTAIEKTLASAKPDVAAGLLDILAGRKDKPDFATLLKYTTHNELKVRAAAIASVGKVADTPQLAALTGIIVKTTESGDRKAAEKALTAAASRLRDKDRTVGAIAPALAQTQGNVDARAALMRVLGSIGSPKAYQVVHAGLTDKDDNVKDAVIRALADWPDDTPTKELLDIAKSSPKQTHQVLALRGYVRMIGVRKDRSAAESLAMCKQAMDVARRDEERRLVLSALGNVPTTEALAIALASLPKEPLKNEAAIAAIRIAKAVSSGDREAARAAIAKATAATDDQGVHKQAKEATDFIERSEDFITTWLISGPYKGGKTGIKHPPEQPDAKDIKWKLIAATGQQPGFVDLNRDLGAPGDCAGYMRCQLWSPKAQDAQIEIGTDDGVKVWVNDKVVHDKDVPRSFNLNEDKVKITLNEGWNTLLVKVVQGGGDWSGCVRVRAADGGKLQGYKVKAE